MNLSKAYAKLVYLRLDQVKAVVESTDLKPQYIDCRDLKVLKQLTHSVTLFVTEAELMRGVDYRVLEGHGATKGIALFIMTRFDTHRAFIQGLGT